MKRLLIGLASVSLIPSAILPTMYVVSCSTANAKEIDEILQRKAENIIGKQRYAPVNLSSEIENEKAVSFQTTVHASFKSESNPVQLRHVGKTNSANLPDDLPTLEPEQIITEQDLNKIYNDSFKLYNEAKDNFKKLLWFDNKPKHEQVLIQWKFLLFSDYSDYGKSSKEWTYEFEEKVLEILEDQIITPLFQITTAQFAVLRHNYIYTKQYQSNLEKKLDEQSISEEEKNILKDLQNINLFLEKGYFIPLFKVILMERVRSKGSSRTKIVFDRNLYNFVNSGGHGKDEFLVNENKKIWVYDKNGKLKSDIDNSGNQISADLYATSVAADLNDIEVQKLYLYDITNWDIEEDV